MKEKEPEVKLFTSSDMIAIMGEDTLLRRAQADLNQCAGPAFTLFHGKEPIMCGGVRNQGVGEAWFIARPEDLQRLDSKNFDAEKRQMVRYVRVYLDKIAREYGFYRLWGNCDISKRFMAAVGFTQVENGFTHTFPVRAISDGS